MLTYLRVLLVFDTSVHYNIQQKADTLQPDKTLTLYDSSTLAFQDGNYLQLAKG